MIRRSSSFNTGRIDHLYQDPHESDRRLKLCYGDLADASSLQRVHHARGAAGRGLQPRRAVAREGLVRGPRVHGRRHRPGHARLLGRSASSACTTCRFYQASSSELYGKVVETPQNETTPFWPRSPYAAAKAYAFHITRNYRESYGMFAVNGILFNHESPRRGETFVTRKISRAAAKHQARPARPALPGQPRREARLGLRRRLRRGHVADAPGRQPDDYVLATGETRSVREFCDLCFSGRSGPAARVARVGRDRDAARPRRARARRGRPALLPPRGGRPAVGRSRPRRSARCSAGSRRSALEELAKMMVESDLEARDGAEAAD